MPAVGRREVLRFAAAGCVCAFCGPLRAAPLGYRLEAKEVARRTYAVFGAPEHFTPANGGAIVNVAFVVAPDGVVVIDTGPSRRYGEALVDLIGRTAPGRPILRVFNTHHHPDHFLGNQVFDPAIIAAPQKVIDNIRAEGDAFATNMYRLLGDWMRGTTPVAPARVVAVSREDVGGRAFSFLELSGHTSCDFVLRDDETGTLFAGDLAFRDRAPTTPHADLGLWRSALATLRATDREALLPGHGPLDPAGDALAQTLDWLDWLDGTLREAVGAGLTMNEAMALPIPARLAALGVARGEFQRSVAHLYPRLEDEIWTPAPARRG
jgi:quinoprotein relay system zinc metallohydrolase 1